MSIESIEPTASARLPPVLRRLAQRHPGTTVRLEVGATGTISARVASADLDIGIATTPPAQYELKFAPLFTSRSCWCCRRRVCAARFGRRTSVR